MRSRKLPGRRSPFSVIPVVTFGEPVQEQCVELLVAEIREAASQPVFEQAFCLRREFKELPCPPSGGHRTKRAEVEFVVGSGLWIHVPPFYRTFHRVIHNPHGG